MSLARLPGSPIAEKDIAEAYAVSRTPVREALLKLADEGLVTIRPQSGTFVARIPLHALPEALVIRRSLEETSARLAAQHGRKGADRLAQTMVDLERTAAAEDREAFHQADDAFHAAVADLAGYPGLWHLTQQVKLQIDRFRRLTLPQAGRFARVLMEHNAVLDAIRSGDAPAAAATMGEHLGNLSGDLDLIADLNPDFFDTSDGTGPPRRNPSAAPGRRETR